MSRPFAGAGTFQYRDRFGHLMEADMHDYIERAGFFGGHSPELIHLLERQCHRGDWVIDAGANVGICTSVMASVVGPSGEVWAIEPLPRNVRRLESLRDQNGLSHVGVFPVALASTSAEAPLRLPAAEGGSAFGSFVATWPSSGTVVVQTMRLDDMVDAATPTKPLRFMKIDVEGFERELLLGAERTLSKWRPTILCEVHDPLLRSAGTSAQELCDTFGALGYRPRPPFDLPRGSLDGVITDVLFAPE